MRTKGLQPSMFVESLKRGILIPVRFGGHLNYLCSAAGPVDRDSKVYLDGSKIKNKFARSSICSMLMAMGYNAFAWYEEISPLSSEGTERFSYHVTGELMQHI